MKAKRIISLIIIGIILLITLSFTAYVTAADTTFAGEIMVNDTEIGAYSVELLINKPVLSETAVKSTGLAEKASVMLLTSEIDNDIREDDEYVRESAEGSQESESNIIPIDDNSIALEASNTESGVATEKNDYVFIFMAVLLVLLAFGAVIVVAFRKIHTGEHEQNKQNENT